MHAFPEYSPKDPTEVIIFGMDFAAILDAGETISTAAWSKATETSVGTETTPLAFSGVADITDDPIVRQKVTGGTDGWAYRLICTITTSAGQTIVGSALLPIRVGVG